MLEKRGRGGFRVQGEPFIRVGVAAAKVVERTLLQCRTCRFSKSDKGKIRLSNSSS